MKEPKNNIFKRFLFSGLFENIYYFLVMHVWLVVSIIGAGLGLMVILFVLELLFPKDVHLLNYALTNRTFTELYENHNYHAAIFVAEGDTSFSSNRVKNYINRDMLRECYTHVGEYSKAEKICRDFMSIDKNLTRNDKEELALLTLKTIAARDLFRLYEKMGDREKQIEMYNVLSNYYSVPQIRYIEDSLRESGVDYPIIDKDNPRAFSMENNLKYDIICGLYLTQPKVAIDSMGDYLNEVWQLPKYSASRKLTIINRLISWHLEQGEIFKAQAALLNGIEVAKLIDKKTDLDPVGEFAEYCYILHDKKNARRFMRVYMRYMDKYYDEDDLDYLLAEMRYIKYSEDDIETVIDKLSHCCEGLRNQISRNFAGMTASQQEYFAKKLEEPFSYALQMLGNNPSNEDLIKLCFENEVFKRGLLLRSDVLLKRALADSKDKTLLGEYDKYILLRRELMAREEISGPGNLARKMYLKSQISSIEKSLSEGCAEFSRENYAEVDISKIKSALNKNNQTLITYVEVPTEQGPSLGAFVLNKKRGLLYRNICSPEDIESFSNSKETVFDLCVQTTTYKELFSNIEDCLSAGDNVVYSPTGIVHRIPLAALYVNNESTLGDRYNMTIVANPIDLVFDKGKGKLYMDEMYVALWGGIQYGATVSEDDVLVSPLRSIVRGKHLSYLPGSLGEVDEVAIVLKGKVRGIKSFTDTNATEASFKNEARNANIVHVSTHGFFNEDKTHELGNVMHNAGLFFANANRVWMDEYRPETFRKEYEDGILRAEEIETQNLASCELVVLSACETGLGEIKGDEGVYGLQRAFKLAGAKCILMSLWQVPDRATKELMNRFYSNLVMSRNIDEAFSQAQKSMRSDNYGVRDWGGFVILH